MRRVLVLIALALGFAPPTSADTRPLQVSLRAAQARDGEAPTVVEVTVRNSSNDAAVAVQKAGTPLDGILTEDVFDVLRDGVPVPFRRIAVKLPAEDADYVVIPPRGAVAATINLGFAYDMSGAGDYSVVFDGALTGTIVPAAAKALSFSGFDGAPQTVTLRSKPVKLKVPAPKRPPGVGPLGALPGAAFKAGPCSAAQLAEIADAERERHRLEQNVLTYLAAVTADGARFDEWFGSHAVTTATAKITQNFNAIARTTVGYNCPASCGIDASGQEAAVFAFVHPDYPEDGI